MGRYTKFMHYLESSFHKHFILINLNNSGFNIIKFVVLFRSGADMHSTNNDCSTDRSGVLLDFKVQKD
jgi:hypothetical protein